MSVRDTTAAPSLHSTLPWPGAATDSSDTGVTAVRVLLSWADWG